MKVTNEKGFFSKIYDGLSDAPEEVSDWWEKSDLKKSLMPGLDKELANQDYANTPLNRLPENKKGEPTKAAFLKKRKDKKDKTKTKLDANKKARKITKEKREAPLVKEGRKTEGLIWDKKFGVYRDNYSQVKKAGGEPDWKKSKVIKDTEEGNEVGLKRYPEEPLIDADKRITKAKPEQIEKKIKISDEVMANQKISDAQIDDHIGKNKRKSKPLNTGSLSQERQDNIKKLFEGKDPEAELIASQYEMDAAINEARPNYAPKQEVVPSPSPSPSPQPKKEPSFPAPVDDFTNTGDLEDEQLEATEFAKLRAENKPVMAEDILKNKNKEQTARIRESTGEWYIDPFTGFALDLGKLDRLQNRRETLEVAGMLPANRRASYLAQNGLINESDLKKMLDPTEKEILELQIKQNTIDKQGLELALGKKKLDNYEDPRKRELRGQYSDFYKTAVKEGNNDSQIYWLNKMELPPEEIKKLSDSMAKASKLPVNLGKYWDSKYAIKWGQVVTLKKSLIDTAGKAFINGEMGFEMGGKTYSSREEYYKNEGLMPHAEVLALGERAKSDGNAKQQLKSYFNQLAIKPSGGLERLMDEDNYQQYMYENFLYRGMGTLLGGEDIYGKMIAEYRQIINPVGLTEKITAKQ
tara:strand:+ start:1014 stop:2927 length:1914 start_codon:yes stop_codon:yes gene_type:complete